MVKNSHPLSIKLNKILSQLKLTADEIIIDLTNDTQLVTFESFERRYLEADQQNDFYTFALEQINVNKEKYTDIYYRQFLSEVNKLKEFKPTLTFKEISLDLLQQYEQFLRKEKKNHTNTIGRSMKRIKYLVKQAYLKKLIKSNPFDFYTIKSQPSVRDYLVLAELDELEKLLKKNQAPHIENTLRAFLFACYTGLRFTDLESLTWSQISDGAIHILMHKTSLPVTIPLSSRALALMGNPDHGKDKVFTMYSNQKCNVYLKAIGIMADINKILSFHVSRHTFATVSLNLGIPLEVVSKLLGHTDLKITQIYAKMMDKTKYTEMMKWEKT